MDHRLSDHWQLRDLSCGGYPPIGRRQGTAGSFGAIADAAYRWLFTLAALIAINLVVEICAYIEIAKGVRPTESIAIWIGSAVFLLCHTMTLLLVIIRAPLMEWMHVLQDLRTSKTKTLSDDEANAIFDRWERTVAERQLYKQEGGITLDQAKQRRFYYGDKVTLPSPR
jgi:type VI protein secretion system component VasK